MEITESLKSEHRIIEKILGAMDSMVEALQKDFDVPVELIREAVDLVQECVDDYHNTKEDELIFPFLTNAGVNGVRTSVQRFSEDHQQNKTYYRNILRGADKLEREDASGKKTIIETVKSFSTTLRRHIQKEDRSLYPSIEKKLKDSQKRRLWEMLEEYEDRRHGKPDLDEFEKRTRLLVIKISDVLSGVRV